MAIWQSSVASRNEITKGMHSIITVNGVKPHMQVVVKNA